MHLNSTTSFTGHSSMRNSPFLTVLTCTVVVSLGAYFRLSHLDAPTLWFDEMFSALMASHSLQYITAHAQQYGLHPPYFYFFLKSISQLGVSDYSLRLCFALVGTFTVYLVYRFARYYFSKSAALLAGLFIAINPLHIWLSRQIRPYSLLIFFFLLSVYFLAKYLRDRKGKNLAKLVAVNTALLCLHFLSFPLVATEILILLVAAAINGTPKRWKHSLLLCLATAITSIPSLYFLGVLLIQGNGYKPTSATTFTVMSENIVSCINEVFFLGGMIPYARSIIIAVFLISLVRLVLEHPKVFIFLLALSLGPLALFLALRFGSGIMPAYVSFLLIPLACCTGFAFECRPKFTPLATTFILAIAVICFMSLRGVYFQQFETENATYASSIFNTGKFKTIARTLPEAIGPGDLVIMSDQFFSESVNWYLNQFQATNPVSNQRLSPDDRYAYFNFVGFRNDFAHFAKTTAGLFDLLGQPVSINAAADADVYRFLVDRHPVELFSSVPHSFKVKSMPHDVYAKAFSLSDITINPFWGGSLVPTKSGVPGRVEFAFDNKSDGHAHSIWLWFAYSNTGSGNALRTSVAFDGEPAREYFSSNGADARKSALVKIERSRKYGRFRIAFDLTAERNTPSANLGDLEKLELKTMSAYICNSNDESQCLTQIYVDVLPQRLLTDSVVPQKMVTLNNVVDAKSDQEGWSRYACEDSMNPGTILYEAASDRDEFVFYPRASGKDSVISVFEKSGTSKTLLFSLRGLENDWTPIGLQVVFKTITAHRNSPRTLEFELVGKGAELWHTGEKILF